MAIELPGWVVTAFYVIGLPWPGIDEDQLRAWAKGVRTFADDVTGSSAKTHATVTDLAASSDSAAVNALAARWEHHNQLIADLHGPMNDFAEALDLAADVVVMQKEAVIAAAIALAGEFTATQIGAFFTFGADEAAVAPEVALARSAVKFALEYLENELIGKLTGIAAQDITSHINGFLGSLLNDAVPVMGEVQGLKLSYKQMGDAVKTIRGHAAETQEAGERANRENSGRDIEDPGEGGSDGDGGRWAAVVQAVKQMLIDIGIDLFQNLTGNIFRVQMDMADDLEHAMQSVEDADSTQGADARDPGTSGSGVTTSQAPAPEPAGIWDRLGPYDHKTTKALFVADDGTEVPLESGDQVLPNTAASSHGEGKAALLMREKGWSSGTVYHNNTDGTDPFCDRMIPNFLPEDATLTVVPPPDTVPKTSRWVGEPKTYSGNGNVPKRWGDRDPNWWRKLPPWNK